jgi:hypothetical protein
MRFISVVLPAPVLPMIAVVWPALLGKLIAEIGTRVSEFGVDHLQLAPLRPSGDIVLLTGLDAAGRSTPCPAPRPSGPWRRTREWLSERANHHPQIPSTNFSGS